MKYFEFVFQTTPYNELISDVLTGVLGEAGFESFVVEDNKLLAYIQQNLYNESLIAEAVNNFPLPNVNITYHYSEAEDKNWNEEWEKHYFQPIVIGDRCVIHNTFHHDVPKAQYDIVINPQMAFGTGHHETTTLIMNQLLEADLNNKRVLDMGCGTSILSILASMRSAQSCLAIDIDDWCVRNSLENLKLNHITNIQVIQGDAASLSDKGLFDVIVANINRNILLNDMACYVKCMQQGTELYMSGFYTDDVPFIRQKAEALGLTFCYHRSINKWAMTKFVLEA